MNSDRPMRVSGSSGNGVLAAHSEPAVICGCCGQPIPDLTRHGEGWTREQDQFINYARSHGSSYKLIAHTLGTRDRLVIGRINNLRAKRPA
ncbi:MAG TPA: hypothetical protein VL614_21490 [Acetobacteraceae bacterium]|jgi:hypothetical protein|nr:hypothetical protein [Acetobacteraceae bacterium]